MKLTNLSRACIPHTKPVRNIRFNFSDIRPVYTAPGGLPPPPLYPQGV